MATLAIGNDEIQRNLAMILGLNRDPSTWSPQEQDDTDRIIRNGRRRFLNAHAWQFLSRELILHIEAPDDSFTGDIVNGVVTLDVGVWPTDPTGYRLAPTGADSAGEKPGGVYEIVSFDSGLQMATLADTSLSLDTVEFTLYRTRYSLPSIFVAFESPLTVENSIELRQVGVFPDYYTKAALSWQSAYTNRPEMFSVYQTQDDETGIPVWYVNLWPLPDKAYSATARIRVMPGDSLAEVGDVAHALFSEAMQENIFAVAEQMYNGAPGVHSQQAEELTNRAINMDKRVKGVRYVKANTDGRARLPWYWDLSAKPGQEGPSVNG